MHFLSLLVDKVFPVKTYIQCSEQISPVWKPTFWEESTDVAKTALKYLSDFCSGDVPGLFWLMWKQQRENEPEITPAGIKLLRDYSADRSILKYCKFWLCPITLQNLNRADVLKWLSNMMTPLYHRITRCPLQAAQGLLLSAGPEERAEYLAWL